MHVSAGSRDAGQRPRLQQAVSFEVEVGPKGKRALKVRPIPSRQASPRRAAKDDGPAPWGTATLCAIPAFVAVYLVAAMLWRPPMWAGAVYVAPSLLAFAVYAIDKSAASRGARRTPESTLHLLALAGGWPGALLAQQWLRHKSAKLAFRRVFWFTVLLNVAVWLALVWWLRPRAVDGA